MDFDLRSLVHLLLVAPCFALALRWYRLQRREKDRRTRIWQRLGIVWAMVIFVVISLSVDCFWSTYAARA